MSYAWFCACVLVVGKVISANRTYPVCGSDVVGATLEKVIINDVNRLLASKSSEAITSIQLTKQNLFYTRNASVEALIQTANNISSHASVGRLAYHALAAKSVCQDPEDFHGVNIIEKLRKRLKRQCHHKGSRPRPPADGWYSFGLAIQAQCVSNVRIDECDLDRILQLQSRSGRFGHSVDETSQMLLAIKCLRKENWVRSDPVLRHRLHRAAHKARNYLVSRVVHERNNIYIGNKYATAEALLALKNGSGHALGQLCNVIVDRLISEPTDKEPEAFLVQRLPALGGKSVLSLQQGWVCTEPEAGPVSAVPSTTSRPASTNECEAIIEAETDSFVRVGINVTLTVDASLHGLQSSRAQVLNVPKDFTLLQIMQYAKCFGNFRFKTKMTSWGPSLISVNGVKARKHHREFWALINGGTGKWLSKGIGQYLPSHNENIILRLSTY